MNISETLNQLAIVIYFLASYPLLMVVMCRVGHIYIYVYIRSTYVIFDRQITKYTVIYGVHIHLWPTLVILLYMRSYMFVHIAT